MIAAPLPVLVETAPRHLFFTGKGGVGKTSLACAVAVALADRGRRVLLVSTDPASNLDEVLATPLARTPRAVAGAPGLEALNIDPAAAAAAYRDKVIGPLRGVLPPGALRSMEEQLSGACTMEIAAFDEFARLLGAAEATADFDHVVFDTAPTGHALRLLLLPRAWSHFLDANTTGTSCLGPLAGLDAQRGVYAAAMAALADAGRTAVVLVSRAQQSALREAGRTAEELAAVGLRHQLVVLNGLFAAGDRADPTAVALARRGAEALASATDWIGARPCFAVPLRARGLLGAAALRALMAPDESAVPPGPGRADFAADAGPLPVGLRELVDAIATAGRGVVMTMGKGGVGKTTVAAAVAVELARRGRRVRLTTTDPAAHLAATVAGECANLTLGRIDPAAETAAYVAEVLATQGAALDPASRALLEEDLRSPCTEEIAVFRAFARIVAEGRDSIVVLDTAPTGHTLLLLDATEAYHRELGRQARETAPEEVRELLPRLRDPAFTHVLVVTLPEATPVHEAAALQADLRRAGIEPTAWIVNQCFALTGTRDPLLAERARRELPFLREVAGVHARRSVALPWLAVEPAGVAGLAGLFAASAATPVFTMTTYVYETIPRTPGEQPSYFEVKQSMAEAPLTAHPDDGRPVRRVILGGYGVLKTAASAPVRDGGDCGCGPGGCCG